VLSGEHVVKAGAVLGVCCASPAGVVQLVVDMGVFGMSSPVCCVTVSLGWHRLFGQLQMHRLQEFRRECAESQRASVSRSPRAGAERYPQQAAARGGRIRCR
jgi:hypothetical protein